jgi:hypothetical protein
MRGGCGRGAPSMGAVRPYSGKEARLRLAPTPCPLPEIREGKSWDEGLK